MKKAFDNPPVTILARDEARGYFRLWLGSLKTEIEVQMKWRSDIERWGFTQSHAIRTPEQDAPYWTNRPWNDSPAAALRQVIRGLLDNYEPAVAKGLTPDESWLVPNREGHTPNSS